MKIPHLVQYQGSKRNLAPIILQSFPARVKRLIEPFAGTAAISIACATKNIAEKFIINDINYPLIKLLEMVVNQPEEISNFYAKIWREQFYDSLEHYYQIREKFNQTSEPRLFLYLLARCIKGSIRYNSEGLFNQSPDKRRKGTRPETMRKNIFHISYLLKGKTTFKSVDYKKILSLAKEGDLIYMDPPYQGVCGDRDSRYCSGINFDEFVNELKKLNEEGIDFIISYDGSCGDKSYGKKLPDFLNLKHVKIIAGRSTQATLLGKKDITIESLYISNSLVLKVQTKVNAYKQHEYQLSIF